MAIAALFPWPYAYYHVLRWVVCGALLLLLVLGWRQANRHDHGRSQWIWVTVVVAPLVVLFNPVAPVEMTRWHWRTPDLAAAVLLALAPALTFHPRWGERSDWGVNPTGYATVATLAVGLVLYVLLSGTTAAAPAP